MRESQRDAAEIGWAQRFFSAMEPCSTGWVLLNFPGNEGHARVHAAYDPGNCWPPSAMLTAAAGRLAASIVSDVHVADGRLSAVGLLGAWVSYFEQLLHDGVGDESRTLRGVVVLASV